MSTFTEAEVAAHASDGDCWIIVSGKVYDVSEFLDDHPGGKAVLLNNGGKDATDMFEMLHSDSVLKKYGQPRVQFSFDLVRSRVPILVFEQQSRHVAQA